MAAREIVIFEPQGSGHHMVFAGAVAAAIAAARLGPVRLVTTGAAMAEPATRALVASGRCGAVDTLELADVPLPLRCLLTFLWHCSADPWPVRLERRSGRHTHVTEATETLGRQTAALVRYVAAAGGARRFRAVFIPSIDKARIIPLGFWRAPFGAIPFGGIAINPRCHLHAQEIETQPRAYDDVIEALSFRRLVRNRRLSALFTIDPYFARYLRHDKVHYVADPARLAGTPVPGALRRHLGIAPDAVVVLLYGELGSRRKAEDAALKAMADRRVPSSLVLVAAGRRNHPDTRELPEPEASALRACGRFIEINDYVDDETEHALFDAADLVWVCYRRHSGSSNVLIKAGQARRPVLACREGVIGRLVGDTGCGLVCVPDDHDAVVAALVRLAGDARLRARLGASGWNAFAGHTFETFAAPIVAWLRGLGA